MQVTETLADGLKRELKVVIGQGELGERFAARLGEVKDTVQLKGFRKGKVPTAHLKKLYGRSVMADRRSHRKTAKLSGKPRLPCAHGASGRALGAHISVAVRSNQGELGPRRGRGPDACRAGPPSREAQGRGPLGFSRRNESADRP